MEQVNDTFDFFIYVPLCLAILLWIHHLYIRRIYGKFENMKRIK